MSFSANRLLVKRVVALILESIQDGQAKDHVARCLQDSFGAPAYQAQAILKRLSAVDEEETGYSTHTD